MREGGRVFLNCQKKDKERGAGLCKAHVHMVQKPKLDGTFIYRVKGCLAHCHPPSTTSNNQKDPLCKYDHEHVRIDMAFETMEAFQTYLEDNELDCQFTKRSHGKNYKNPNAHYTRHVYICSKHILWDKRKHKRKDRDYFDCPAR